MSKSQLDWSDPTKLPTSEFRLGPVNRGDGQPDPRYIQTNLYTLARAEIGGIYEVIALEVERQHLDILEPWRLDSGAPSAVDYIRHNQRQREEGTL